MEAALLDRLREIVGDQGLLPASGLSERALRAAALVRPRSTEEVSAVLRACHAARQPVVVHGGLTGLVRGTDAAPHELILSLERMDRIEEIDPVARTATVQAGVRLQVLQETVAEQGLLFPLDLGARGSATLGGNVATNAGGNRVVRYGMMREMVLGLEAVLADGTVVSALNRLIKNNTGYDLKQLFIGSEGTLGVVTRAVLRLRERPRGQHVALVAADRFDGVVALLRRVDQALGGQLSAFEAMWREHYQLVTHPPAASVSPLPGEHAYFVLVESHGADVEPAALVGALESARAAGLVADAVVARSQAERNALWAIRDDVGQLRRLAPILAFDVSLPIAAMERYASAVRSQLAGKWPGAHCSIFGHLADGNLHFVFAPGKGDEATRHAVEEIVYAPLAGIGGAISAEHGIGLEKKPWLSISRTPEEIALMRQLKSMLDPLGILNPGKVVDPVSAA
ncbi:MAG: FAD-binding oxidoreductase [Myxococcales bacterium]